MADAPAVNWREGLTMIEQQSYLLEHCVGSDCTFLVGEQECRIFQAHKLMLVRASSVFEAMFLDRSMKETGKVEITDIQAHIFEHLLRFVYTDKIRDDLSVEDLIALCLAADKYLMFNLREACIMHLCSKVNVENMWSMLQVADLLKKDKLYEAAMKLICEYAQAILVSDIIYTFSHAILVAIVQQETLKVKSEMEVIDACLRWAKRECKRQALVPTDRNIRKVLSFDIISHLRFLTLSPSEFAVGPGAGDWLTSQEKVHIFSCLNAPNKFNVSYWLCSNLKPRSKYVNSVFEQIPRILGTYCFELPRKCQKIGAYGRGINEFNIQCKTDLCIKSFDVFSQINDSKLIAKSPNFQIFKGSTYVEDISISIKRDINPGLITCGTFSFQGEVAYNSSISLKCDQVVKLSKDCKYVIILTRKVRGYYPVCDELINDLIFIDGKVKLLLISSQQSVKCPLRCISIEAYC